MSLINKMLNDLEKSKQNDSGHQKELLGISSTIRKRHKPTVSKKIIAGLFILTLSVLSVSVCHRYYVKLSNGSSVIAPSKKAAKEGPEVNTKISKKQLKDIILKQTNKGGSLDLVLTGVVQYDIEHQSKEKISIVLSNVNLLDNVPVTLKGDFIESLDVKEDKNNVTITMVLLSGTNIEDLKFIDGKYPSIRLLFTNPQLLDSTMFKVPTPMTPEQQADEEYKEILNLLRVKNISEATHRLRMLVAEYPENLQAREMLVSLLIEKGELQKAGIVLDVGLDKHSYYVPYVKLKAYILTKQNKVKNAIDVLNRYSVNFNANDIEYLSLLATLFQQNGDYKKAAEVYNKLAKMQPQKTAWWIGLGIALESAGQKNASTEAYQNAYNNSDVPPELIFFLNSKLKK